MSGGQRRGRGGGGRRDAGRGGGPRGGRDGGRPSAPSRDEVDRADLIPGRQPVTEALRAERQLATVVVDRRLGDDLERIAELARSAGVEVRVATRDELDAIAGEIRHQGVVALAEPFTYTPIEDLLTSDLVVVLDGVTDARNLGAIARAAHQAGAGGLVIRSRRAASPSPAAEKASAGALSWLPVAQVSNISTAVQTLRDGGLWSVGLAGEADQTLWDTPLLDERTAIVVGDEGAGLSRLVAERVDSLIAIPMSGQLDSLNAATALAVTAFEWRRRHRV